MLKEVAFQNKFVPRGRTRRDQNKLLMVLFIFY